MIWGFFHWLLNGFGLTLIKLHGSPGGSETHTVSLFTQFLKHITSGLNFKKKEKEKRNLSSWRSVDSSSHLSNFYFEKVSPFHVYWGLFPRRMTTDSGSGGNKIANCHGTARVPPLLPFSPAGRTHTQCEPILDNPAVNQGRSYRPSQLRARDNGRSSELLQSLIKDAATEAKKKTSRKKYFQSDDRRRTPY